MSSEVLSSVVESVAEKLIREFGVEAVAKNLPELAMAYAAMKSAEPASLYGGSSIGFMADIEGSKVSETSRKIGFVVE